jgi:hypothetical protein
MDQDNVRGRSGKRLKAVPYRILSSAAAVNAWQEYWRKGCKPRDAGIIKIAVIGVDHDEDAINSGMREETHECPGENRMSLEAPILLRGLFSRARTTSCGNDEGGN